MQALNLEMMSPRTPVMRNLWDYFFSTISFTIPFRATHPVVVIPKRLPPSCCSLLRTARPREATMLPASPPAPITGVTNEDSITEPRSHTASLPTAIFAGGIGS